MEEKLNKIFLNVEDIAEMFSVHKKTMERIIRTDKTFPKAIVISERIRRWRSDDVEAWLKDKQH